MIRKIVQIDEERCDGCGLCVPSCAEGALEIIDGKARLAAEVYCDGLGACLGECPQDAITVIEREAEAFDEEEVAKRVASAQSPTAAEPALAATDRAPSPVPSLGGCPGSRVMSRQETEEDPRGGNGGGVPSKAPSALRQWPIQLHLVPPSAPFLQDCDLLICADCVPFAVNGFHENVLAGRSVAIACPKLDQTDPYIEKLAAIFSGNAIRSLTVAIMEVPCCMGLAAIVRQALSDAGSEIEMDLQVYSLDGTRKNVGANPLYG